MLVRLAQKNDLPTIHTMAHDTWGEGLPMDEHVARCLASPKYKKGQWFVLEQDGELKCTLICYRDAFGLPENVIGIGSVATMPIHRKKGFASKLLREVMDRRSEVDGFFLFSEVDPTIYAKHGFVILPKEFQRYVAAVSMMRPAGKSLDILLSCGFKSPDYF